MGERIIDLSMDIKSGMVANRDFAGIFCAIDKP